jgi:hypothetical protein
MIPGTLQSGHADLSGLGATDLRKSFEGLGDLVAHQFQRGPAERPSLCFRQPEEKPDQAALFRRHGVWVCAKRLMGQGCFAWPKTTEPGALRIVAEELTLLLTGIDLEKTRPRPWWRKAA